MSASSSQLPRTLSLRWRVTLGFITLAILISGLILTFVYFNSRNQLRESLRQRLISIVSVAALQQDGDKFPTILSAEDPEYSRVWKQNTAILNADTDLVYVYTMRYDDEGLYFVVDAGDPEGSGFSPYGTRYYEPGPVLAANYRTIKEPLSEVSFYQDEYGRFLSAYAPIRDHTGQVTGIIAADISANKIVASENKLLLFSIGIFAATLPLIGLLGWWFGTILSTPIHSLTEASLRISAGELNYRPLIKTQIPEIRSLNQSFFSMADQQKSLIGNLEERVAARTTDLSLASEKIKNRASQLQTIAEVAHSVSLIQEIEDLLDSIVNLISERFGFYHIGIFLMDKESNYAVLSAANSAGGQKMLSRGHKLKVGEEGIVGYVADSAKPRIALDVGQDATFFNNPDLPETRSEMALPLLVRGSVIGILDIQSKETSAFKEEDFDVFHILADQVAIAIENARLISETKRALAKVEKSYIESVTGGWSRFAEDETRSAVRYSAKDNQISAVQSDYPEIKKALESNRTIAETKNTSTLAIPLSVRGTVIGILDIRIPDKYEWTEDGINTVERIAEHVSLALENARLYNEVSRRAEREKTVAQITTNIRSTTNPEAMIQTALEELRKVLGVNEIGIRPYMPNDSLSEESNPSPNP